tara:strand:+ start:1597 stop:2847 length:1251 start_codon:yes stop_codon:yes gene_type:complete
MGWSGSRRPSSGEVRCWQMEQLRAVIEHARANSPFYGRTLAGFDVEAIRTAEDFSRLPMMTAGDLREYPEQLLCVSQDDIARVVTLHSSGTTGKPKRVFHTQDDLEATINFFDWGMRIMIGPGQTALVLMPGERTGGVGMLLAEALTRFGARCVPHGILEDGKAALDQIMAENASCIVGPAAHVNLIAYWWERLGMPKGRVQSVLLCWDAAPEAVVRNLERIFGCRVFRHWGMIETGLGGAVECEPGSGMHLREADVYLEIVDPDTGKLVPDGDVGEIVVSTPLRRGMPLIRYRTGDSGRILPDQCVCGSPMRRLDPHVSRISDGVPVGSNRLRLADLNETLYPISGLADFAVALSKDTLFVRVCGSAESGRRAHDALASMPVVAEANLAIEIEMNNDAAPAVPGLGKRQILDTEW